MGKATLDLPDPLEQPTSGAPGHASADDLLAQLAGEEIDRLLSEADVYPDEPVAEPVARGAASSPPANPTDVPGNSTPAPSSGAPGVTDADLSNQLDELFNNIVDSVLRPDDQAIADEAAAKEWPVGTARADREADEQAPPSPPTAEAASAEAGMSVAERSALDLESDPAEPVLAVGSAEAPDDDDQALPLWLRPLEWLNAPLESCPDAWRQAMGKVALLTSFNALAVLVYVLFFRKH